MIASPAHVALNSLRTRTVYRYILAPIGARAQGRERIRMEAAGGEHAARGQFTPHAPPPSDDCGLELQLLTLAGHHYPLLQRNPVSGKTVPVYGVGLFVLVNDLDLANIHVDVAMVP